MNEVLPEPFLEALANQLALHAANYNGRLAAAPALANLFQVLFFTFFLSFLRLLPLHLHLYLYPPFKKNMQSMFIFFALLC